MKLKIIRYTFLVLLVAWMCVIFFFSSETSTDSSDTSEGVIAKVVSAVYPEYDEWDIADKEEVIDRFTGPIRKAAHFFEFSVLGIFAFIFFGTFTHLSSKYSILTPLAFGLFYAVSDEVHQLFVSGRACKAVDVFIDFSGVMLAVIFSYLIALRFGGDEIG